MMYYKVIKDDEFIGVGTTQDLRKYQSKHSIMLACDESEVQYIQIGDVIYHAMWMVPETVKGLHPIAEVIEITEDEYNTLKDAIDSGEEIIPDEPIEPEPEVPETPDENTEITLDFVKQKKISEMSKACENSIIAGADVTLTDGNTYHFSFTEHDQSRIGLLASSARMAAMLEQMGMPTGETEQSYPWNPDNGDCVYYSRNDMILIGTAYEATVTYHKSYYHALRDYINAMDDIQDVTGVMYGMEVPEEYWGVVYRDIMK